ncbi:hypothetical protein HZA56_17345 [Candidatus Poribacteria bacterium]|nr:hypothetical protein [Candidatus Poribacteria bacterium]
MAGLIGSRIAYRFDWQPYCLLAGVPSNIRETAEKFALAKDMRHLGMQNLRNTLLLD